MRVSRFSGYSEEEELLFFGEGVRLVIDDIVELHSGTSHRKEIRCFVAFQRLVTGEDVKSEMKRVDLALLLALIERQKATNQNAELETAAKEAKTKKASKYGQALFGFFCNNAERKSVRIRDLESLPQELKKALFESEHDGRSRFSLTPLVTLFASLAEIALLDLDMRDMDASDDYLDAALECVQSIDMAFGANLKRITFQSAAQVLSKPNPQLRALEAKYAEAFEKCEASIAYEVREGTKHCVVITRHKQTKNAGLFVRMLLENQKMKAEIEHLVEMDRIHKQKEELFNESLMEMELRRHDLDAVDAMFSQTVNKDDMKHSNEDMIGRVAQRHKFNKAKVQMAQIDDEKQQEFQKRVDEENEQWRRKLSQMIDEKRKNADLRGVAEKFRKREREAAKMRFKDDRYRAFRIMRNENQEVDFESLFDYIAHYGPGYPDADDVKRFFDCFRNKGLKVGKKTKFSKKEAITTTVFIKVIPVGDNVISAFGRFKKKGFLKAE